MRIPIKARDLTGKLKLVQSEPGLNDKRNIKELCGANLTRYLVYIIKLWLYLYYLVGWLCREAGMRYEKTEGNFPVVKLQTGHIK